MLLQTTPMDHRFSLRVKQTPYDSSKSFLNHKKRHQNQHTKSNTKYPSQWQILLYQWNGNHSFVSKFMWELHSLEWKSFFSIKIFNIAKVKFGSIGSLVVGPEDDSNTCGCAKQKQQPDPPTLSGIVLPECLLALQSWTKKKKMMN